MKMLDLRINAKVYYSSDENNFNGAIGVASFAMMQDAKYFVEMKCREENHVPENFKIVEV